MGNTSGMEENKMQNITIGKSGIEVPFLGMGTWAIGGGSWRPFLCLQKKSGTAI